MTVLPNSVKREKISVILIATNEEGNIARALKSARWADEIVLIDGGSTDRTREIAKDLGATVYENPWPGFAAQRNFAMAKASHLWVFSLDADEEFTPELQKEIETVLSQDASNRKDGYFVPRLTQFCGRWIHHSGWYPDHVLRFFRTDRASVKNVRIHESVSINGSVGHLKSHMRHYSYPNLSSYLQRFNTYTTLASQDLAESYRAGITDIVIHPIGCFLKMYFVRQGFRDGLEGFILAILSSTYVLIKYYKTMEIQRGRS